MNFDHVLKIDFVRVLNVLKFRPTYASTNALRRRQLGSVVRLGDLNAKDLDSNPRLGLLNEFLLGDPRGNFAMFCK